MATFLTDLFSSIFTPGPTPTLITATNISFAALQSLLFALLLATYSVHFIVLSFLSAFLWYAINWFVRELEAASQKEKETGGLRDLRTAREKDEQEEDSGEETEGAGEMGKGKVVESGGLLDADRSQGELRKRRSLGEHSSGDLSTDSEWDKVGESEGDTAGSSNE